MYCQSEAETASCYRLLWNNSWQRCVADMLAGAKSSVFSEYATDKVPQFSNMRCAFRSPDRLHFWSLCRHKAAYVMSLWVNMHMNVCGFYLGNNQTIYCDIYWNKHWKWIIPLHIEMIFSMCSFSRDVFQNFKCEDCLPLFYILVFRVFFFSFF